MKITVTFSTCGAALLLAAQLHAADGVVISGTTAVGGKPRSTQIQITKDHIRSEIVSASGEAQTMIFDAVKQTLWIVNSDKKTYSEMTKADVEKFGAQMADVNVKMQEMIKNMSAEQRARMEQMMKGRGAAAPGAPPRKTEYRRAGADRVSKWACAKYEGFRDNKKTSEVCTVDLKEIGISAADLDAAKQMAEFFAKISPQNADRASFGNDEEQGFSGFPVRQVTIVNDAQTVREVTDVSRQNIPDAAFALPQDVKKIASPFAR